VPDPDCDPDCDPDPDPDPDADADGAAAVLPGRSNTATKNPSVPWRCG